MNGDYDCDICGKVIPRAAEYGHMVAVHGWDYEIYHTKKPLRRWGEEPAKKEDEVKLEGYDPILLSGDSRTWRYEYSVNIFGITFLILCFSVEYAVAFIGFSVFMANWYIGERRWAADILNGMIEQLRLRVSDLESASKTPPDPPSTL